MSYTITLLPLVGSFASNKDIASELRQKEILPRIEKNEEVIIDFEGVEAGTQSFVHALIAEPIQLYNNKALNLIKFKSCSPVMKTLIGLVTDYTQISNSQ